MSTTLSEFSEKFRVAELTIFRLHYWTWSIRPVHCTLGSGILSLNRFCTSFSTITTDEASELGMAAQGIERSLSAAFHPDKFNYIMLMMVDAHLHFHVIPRYATLREFSGVHWVDAGWPTVPTLGDGSSYQNDPVLPTIRETLIKVSG